MLQSELIRGGIDLAEIIDTGVTTRGCTGFDEVGQAGNKKEDDAQSKIDKKSSPRLF